MKRATKLCVNVAGLNNQEISFDRKASIRGLTQQYTSTHCKAVRIYASAGNYKSGKNLHKNFQFPWSGHNL